MSTDDAASMSQRVARVGVYSHAVGAMVTEITLPPRSSIIVGCCDDATVAVSPDLGIERVELIRDGAWLLFAAVARVNVVNDAHRGDHVQGTPEELTARGVTSPVPLRWARLKLTLHGGESVLVEYLPPGVSSRQTSPGAAASAGPAPYGPWQPPYS